MKKNQPADAAAKPVSLLPLSFDQAVDRMLATKPQKAHAASKKVKKGRTKAAPTT